MDGNWWTRFSVVIAALLIALFVLAPNFVGQSAHDRAMEKAENLRDGPGADADVEEVEEELPWWQAILPDTRLNLGLDLQGGIDLTLDVKIEEAVLSSVSRDINTLVDSAETEGLELTEARRVRGEPALDVLLPESVEIGELRDFMQLRFSGYIYRGPTEDSSGVKWHRFEISDDEQKEIGTRAVEQAVETLRSRVDETGVKEPSIVKKGDRRINIQLPGDVDEEEAIATLKTAAVLEFYLVDEEFNWAALMKGVDQARTEMLPEEFIDDGKLNDWLIDNKLIGRNNLVLWEYTVDQNGDEVRLESEGLSPLPLKDTIILTGDDVNDASVGMDQYNRPNTSLGFKPEGGRVFGEITGANVGKRFAIVLDGKIKSAPSIREKISGGRAQISMGTGDSQEAMKEASVLSLVLRTGALPAPVDVAEIRIVGPSMGADAIDAGLKSTMLGGFLVIFAMAIYYRKAGLVADIALTLNVLFVMALLAGFGATLTLPGIAGIALTVGMAVDANIIIFERIREERRLGKRIKAAVDTGYESALSAVLDANITTGIAGIVLYSYGTGPIKGFAVTLLIGIVTTLFTAIFVSRVFIDLVTKKTSGSLVF